MTPEKVGAITPNEISQLTKAHSAAVQAHATLQFVQRHLADVYSLTDTQAIESNGDIVDLRIRDTEKPSDADADTPEAVTAEA